MRLKTVLASAGVVVALVATTASELWAHGLPSLPTISIPEPGTLLLLAGGLVGLGIYHRKTR